MNEMTAQLIDTIDVDHINCRNMQCTVHFVNDVYNGNDNEN